MARYKQPSGMKRLWKLRQSTRLCKDFYVVDIETGKRPKGQNIIKWCLDARPQSFIFAVVYGYNYRKVVFSVAELKSLFLEPRFKKRKVFAHNGGGYDYLGIYGNIYDVDPNAIFNGKFISFTNGNCTFADSMNVFVGASVKVIGKMMGLFKGTLGDSGFQSPDLFPRKGVREILTEGFENKDIFYCFRDCEIIWQALFSVFEFAGDIKITQASLSMTYYRRYHQPFHIDHNENTKFFWQSYFGGRCEAFVIGVPVNGRVVDINSAYPFNMKKNFPNPKILKHEKNIPVKLFIKYLEWYEGMAEISVVHADTDYGFLPVKRDGKLLFPVGKITGTWNFPEIRYALEKGILTIQKVNYVVYSEPMESPFVSYVDTLNEMKTNAKLSGNKFEEDRAKRFSNSLYGKFAQRILEENIYIPDIVKSWDEIMQYQKDGRFVRLVTFNKKRNDAFLVVKAGKKIDVSYAIPSFASYITSYTRVMLLDKILQLSKNNKILYCDTDSVFFEGEEKIVDELQLGGWKLENKKITKILGLKNYKYIESEKEIWKIKGIPVDKGYKTKIFNDDGSEEQEFNSVSQIGENTFEYYNLVKTKESLRRNLDAGIVTKRIKEIKGTYDKRVILFNGETKPIKI